MRLVPNERSSVRSQCVVELRRVAFVVWCGLRVFLHAYTFPSFETDMLY